MPRVLPIGDTPVRRQLLVRDQLAGVDEPELALADHDHSGALATLEARLKVLGPPDMVYSTAPLPVPCRYVKLVEWPEEDQCFIGSCPGVIGPCCHGPDEVEVYRELCGIVDEWLEILRREDGALPRQPRISGAVTHPSFGAGALRP